MAHVAGVSRDQRVLVAPSLDELIGAAHPVRVIDAFVASLDLAALGFAKVAAEATGRPAYHPADLVKLYLYGYLNQVRSSRRLAREAERNVEVQWLINRVSPAFKTVADFRRDHPQALVGVCRAFIGFCRTQALYGAELVAIDGSKIEAVASRKAVLTPKGLAKQLAGIDRRIAAYLSAMDEADRAEAAEDQPGDVAAALATLRERRGAVAAQAQALAAEGLTQKVSGEPEAKLMRTARHGHQVAYNAQVAVDAKHGLIVAAELTNDGNDLRQLLPMALAAKVALAAETLTVVADTGYSNGAQGKGCEAAGVTAIVPRPQTVNPEGDEYFSREAFTYDADEDCWTCPAGERLTLRHTSHARQTWRYATNSCAGCALKPQCTGAAQRSIMRHFHEEDRQAMHARALADPTSMKRRRELAEHPFGILKHMMGTPRFLVRGLAKARAELALSVTGFNPKRAITILGVPTLLQALETAPA